MRYPRSAGSAYEAELETLGEDRYALTVTAHTLLRDLCLFADRLGARSKGGYVTLLPGESFTFEIESTTPLVADQLIAPPVLQDATRFGI
jgi:beta-mannosidase